jgi:3-mercaptopyruvate sulfurtransferase SseA
MRKQGTGTSEGASKAAIAILAIGGLAVAGLVGWAFYRSMQAPVVHTSIAEPAAQEPVTDTHAEHAAVARITPEDLKQKIDRNEVTVIDVRDASSYTQGHIPKALHIPLARVQGEIPYLPKDKPLVFYCT